MKMKKLILALLCVSACGVMHAAKSTSKAMCSQASCQTDETCQCYCSVKCGPREQDEEDRPVYAQKDSEGNSVPAQCYCKQQDVDEYNRHCSPTAPKRIMNRRQQSRRATRRNTKQSN